jgi:hypothetical protein
MVSTKLRRKIVKDVRGVAKAGQEQERRTAAAPIQNLKSDALLDSDETNLVRGRVNTPCGS